jgi:hypothetical protein
VLDRPAARQRGLGQVASVFVGGGTLLRLGPVSADTARDGDAAGQADGVSGAVRRTRQGR